MLCVDATPATAEYKLLRLRQYLKGPALKAIENLGHSEEAYTAVLERLKRNYGGERRKIGRYMEEIERFPLVNMKNSESLESFADLLDVAVVNIKETGLESELINVTSTQQRWEDAKTMKLCFRCLGTGHSGNNCKRSRLCGIDGCQQLHAPELHYVRTERSKSQDSQIVKEHQPIRKESTNVTMTSNDNHSKVHS